MGLGVGGYLNQEVKMSEFIGQNFSALWILLSLLVALSLPPKKPPGHYQVLAALLKGLQK